jgi:hypothetical protein
MPVEDKLVPAHVVENNYMRCDRRNPLSIVETMRYVAVNVENRRQQPAGSYSLATGVRQVVIALENAPSVLGAELSVVGTALPACPQHPRAERLRRLGACRVKA